MMGTAERCKEGSQVWSAKRDTPGSRLKTAIVVQGYRSLTRSTPG